MKKFFAIVLSIALLLGIAGCSGSLEELMASAIQYADSNTAQYNAILEEAGIIHASPVFGENVASYVTKQDNNGIFCADYAYKNDLVTAWAETSYIYVEEYSEDDILNLQRTLRQELDYLDLLDCCTLQINQVGSYLKVSCVFKDVDKQENYEALFAAGASTENAAISMKASEDLQLESGAVKK